MSAAATSLSSPTATSRSTRGPGRPRVLDEHAIVDAALRVVEAHGVGKLSMRAVARELGTPPMTLYGYVPNKDALDVLLVDRMLADVTFPDPETGSWDERLVMFLCDARRTLVERQPLVEGQLTLGGGAVQLLHRGAFGREATRLADGVLDLLREGGFAEEDLGRCFTTLFTYVTGHAEVVASAGGDVFALGARALVAGLVVVLLPGSPR